MFIVGNNDQPPEGQDHLDEGWKGIYNPRTDNLQVSSVINSSCSGSQVDHSEYEVDKNIKLKVYNNYLFGHLLGTGSFAKVKEVLDINNLSRYWRCFGMFPGVKPKNIRLKSLEIPKITSLLCHQNYQPKTSPKTTR